MTVNAHRTSSIVMSILLACSLGGLNSSAIAAPVVEVFLGQKVVPPQGVELEVVFAIDMTSESASYHAAWVADIITAATAIHSSHQNSVGFAAVAIQDYPAPFYPLSCGSFIVSYGDSTDIAYVPVQSLTTDLQQLQSTLLSMTPGHGGDGPEAIGRAIWELAHSASESDRVCELQLSDDRARLLILISTDLPHACDVLDTSCGPQTFPTGPDPGRTATITSDDIEFVIDALVPWADSDNRDVRVILEDNSETKWCYWRSWASSMGGNAYAVDQYTTPIILKEYIEPSGPIAYLTMPGMIIAAVDDFMKKDPSTPAKLVLDEFPQRPYPAGPVLFGLPNSAPRNFSGQLGLQDPDAFTSYESFGALPGMDEVPVINRLDLFNPRSQRPYHPQGTIYCEPPANNYLLEPDNPATPASFAGRGWAYQIPEITLRRVDATISRPTLSLELPDSYPPSISFMARTSATGLITLAGMYEPPTDRHMTSNPDCFSESYLDIGTGFSSYTRGSNFITRAGSLDAATIDRYAPTTCGYVRDGVATLSQWAFGAGDAPMGFDGSHRLTGLQLPKGSEILAQGDECSPHLCSSNLEQVRIDNTQAIDIFSAYHEGNWGLAGLNDSVVHLEGRWAETSGTAFFNVPLFLIRPTAIGRSASNATVKVDLDDTVADLATGNLHYELPLMSAAGAGLPLSFTLAYNSLLGNYNAAQERSLNWISFWQGQGDASALGVSAKLGWNAKSTRINSIDSMPMGPGWSHTFSMRLRPRFERRPLKQYPHPVESTRDMPQDDPSPWGGVELHTPDGNIVPFEWRPSLAGGYQYRHIFVPIDNGARNSFLGDALALQGMYLEFYNCDSGVPTSCSPGDRGAPVPAMRSDWYSIWRDSSFFDTHSMGASGAFSAIQPQYQCGGATLYLADGTKYVFDCAGMLAGINLPSYQSQIGPLDYSPLPFNFEQDLSDAIALGLSGTTAFGPDPNNPRLDLWIERSVPPPGGSYKMGANSVDVVHDSTNRLLELHYDKTYSSPGALETRNRLVAAVYGEEQSGDAVIELRYEMLAHAVDGAEIEVLASVTHRTKVESASEHAQIWEFEYDPVTFMMNRKIIPGGRDTEYSYFDGVSLATGAGLALWFQETLDNGGLGYVDQFNNEVQNIYYESTPIGEPETRDDKIMVVSFLDNMGNPWTYRIDRERARLIELSSPDVQVETAAGPQTWCYVTSWKYSGDTQLVIQVTDPHRGATIFEYSPTSLNGSTSSLPLGDAQVLTAIRQIGVPGTLDLASPASPTVTLDGHPNLEGQVTIFEYDNIAAPTAGAAAPPFRAIYGLARPTRISEPMELSNPLDLRMHAPMVDRSTVIFYQSPGTGNVNRVDRVESAPVEFATTGSTPIVSTFEYTLEGLVAAVTEDSGPGGVQPPGDWVAEIKAYRNLRTEFEYDGITGMPEVINHPEPEHKDEHVYNMLGQLRYTSSAPLDHQTTIEYGPGHLPISITSDANDDSTPASVTMLEYDPALRLYRRTTGRGDGGSYEVLDVSGRFDNFYRPLRVRDPRGVVMAFTYDANDNMISQTIDGATTPAGEFYETVYMYDSINRLVRIREPGMIATDPGMPTAPAVMHYGVTCFSYDPASNIVATLDCFSTSPDISGALVQYRSTKIGYDSLYRPRLSMAPAMTGRPHEWIETRYDDRGRSTECINGSGGLGGMGSSIWGATVLGYDDANRPVTSGALPGMDPYAAGYVPDPNNLDLNSAPSALAALSLATTAVTHDGTGAVVDCSNLAVGMRQVFARDSLQRPTGVYQDLPAGMAFLAGRSYSDAFGNVQVLALESLSSLFVPPSPQIVTVHTTKIGRLGLPEESTNRFQGKTKTLYNPLGELIEQQRPGGGKLIQELDLGGLLDSTAMTSTVETREEVVEVGRDVVGDPVTLNDPREHETQYTRNVRGLPIEITGPDGLAPLGQALGRTTMTYDVFGRPSKTTEYAMSAPGQVLRTIVHAYDVLDRKVSDTITIDPCGLVPTSEVVSYTYDDGGNLASISGPLATYTFEYDSRRRVTKYSVALQQGGIVPAPLLPDPITSVLDVAIEYSFAYEYDDANRITAVYGPIYDSEETRNSREGLGAPRGEAILYEYDPDRDLIRKITSYVCTGAGPSGYEAATISLDYDISGRIARAELADGMALVYQYDSVGQLERVFSENSLADAASMLFEYECIYGYNSRGLLSQVERVHQDRICRYEYDFAGRLVREEFYGAAGTQLLAATTTDYDLAGNRSTVRSEYITHPDQPELVRTYTHESDNSLSVVGTELTIGAPAVFSAGSVVGGGRLTDDVRAGSIFDVVPSPETVVFPYTPLELATVPPGSSQRVTGYVDFTLSTPETIERVELYFPGVIAAGGGVDPLYPSQGVWFVELETAPSVWVRPNVIAVMGGREVTGDLDGNGTIDGDGAIAAGAHRMTITIAAPLNAIRVRVGVFGGYTECGPLAGTAALTEVVLRQSASSLSLAGLPIEAIEFEKTYIYDERRDLARIETTRYPATGAEEFAETFCYDVFRRLAEVQKTATVPLSTPTPWPLAKHIVYGTSATGQRLLRGDLNPLTGSPLSTEHFVYDGPGIGATERAREIFDSSGAMVDRTSFIAGGMDAFWMQRRFDGSTQTFIRDQVGTVEMVFDARPLSPSPGSPAPAHAYLSPTFFGTVNPPTGPPTPTLVSTQLRSAYGAPWPELVAGLGTTTGPWAYGATLPAIGYAGRLTDQDTGFVAMRHRDYDPETGRFLQADPIGHEGGMNLYEYAGGNPVTNVDPLGLKLRRVKHSDGTETYFWQLESGESESASAYFEGSFSNSNRGPAASVFPHTSSGGNYHERTYYVLRNIQVMHQGANGQLVTEQVSAVFADMDRALQFMGKPGVSDGSGNPALDFNARDSLVAANSSRHSTFEQVEHIATGGLSTRVTRPGMTAARERAAGLPYDQTTRRADECEQQRIDGLIVMAEMTFFASTLRSTAARTIAPRGLPQGPLLSPNQINFSQRSVGSTVGKYTDDMAAGNWNWSRSGPLRVMERDGRWVSYDNRRLLAAQRAKVDVPVQIVQPGEIMRPGVTWEQAFKARFTDPRNVSAGGAVPNGGLSTQPMVIPPRR